MLGALGILIVVVAVALVVARPGARSTAAVDAGAGTTRTESTDTTLALVPVTGGTALPATTVATTVPELSDEQIAAARPPAEGPVDATGAPLTPEARLSGEGAILVRPAVDEVRAIDRAKGCRSANDPGWAIVDCGALKRDDGVLLWVVEKRGSGLRALVLRERTAGQWATVLRAADDDGKRWSSIGVRGADVSGDGRPDLVMGFHGRDQASTLGVDVVDGPGSVGLHLGLPGGVARTADGGLEVWARLADGSYDTSVYRVIGGEWRLASSGRTPAGGAPRSSV